MTSKVGAEHRRFQRALRALLTAGLCSAAEYCSGLIDWQDEYSIGQLLDRLCLTHSQVTLVMQLRETDASFRWAQRDRPQQLLAFNNQCVGMLHHWQIEYWPFMPDRGLLTFIHTLPLFKARQHSCHDWEVLPVPEVDVSMEERLEALPALVPVTLGADH